MADTQTQQQGSSTGDPGGPARPPFWRDVRVLRAVLQVGFLVATVALVQWLFSNLTSNLDRLGIRRDFTFLDQPAGFSILGAPDFRAQDTIQNALLIGLGNAVRVAVLGVVLSLVIGIVVGVARLSKNWLVARSASAYVELLRNIPPLVLVIFFYLGVLATLPRLTEATYVGDVAIISNRGIWVAWLTFGDGSRPFLTAAAIAAVIAVAVARWRTAVFDRTGTPHRRTLWATANLRGGHRARLLRPAAADRAEPARARRPCRHRWGVAVPRVPLAAAVARAVRLVVHRRDRPRLDPRGPQGPDRGGRCARAEQHPADALRDPPPGASHRRAGHRNEFLNLTKNVSLGIAVGFAEILRVANTAAGNGQPAPQLLIVVLGAYLFLSLIISVIVNVFNRRLQLVER